MLAERSVIPFPKQSKPTSKKHPKVTEKPRESQKQRANGPDAELAGKSS